MKYIAIITEKGLNFGKDDEKFRKKMSFNIGRKVIVELDIPDSVRQRRFFEGAVVPMATFFQENYDYKDYSDCEKVRDWLKIEFNGEFVTIDGKCNKTGGSTKGKLNDGLIEKIIDWLEDQYGIDRKIVLNEKDYKKWRDTIFPFGGPPDYLSYLVETGKLKKHIK